MYHCVLADELNEGLLGGIETLHIRLKVEDVLDAGHANLGGRSFLGRTQVGHHVLDDVHHEPKEGLSGLQDGIYPLHLFVLLGEFEVLRDDEQLRLEEVDDTFMHLDTTIGVALLLHVDLIVIKIHYDLACHLNVLENLYKCMQHNGNTNSL